MGKFSYKDRTLFYVTFPIQEQAKRRKEWKYMLEPVYSINILNFRLNRKVKKDGYVTYVQLMDVDTKEVFYKKLTLVFLELPRFKKKEHELQTGADKWMFIFKNLTRLENIPDALRNEVFERLFEMAEIAALSEEDRKIYNQSLKNLNKMNSIIAEKNEALAKERKKVAAYRQKVVAFQQKEATCQQEKAALKQENEKLLRLLDFRDVQNN